MKTWIKVNKDGWAVEVDTKAHKTAEEEKNNNLYITDIYMPQNIILDENGNITSTIPSNLNQLKLENDIIVIKSISERNDYDIEQKEIKRIELRDDLTQCTKYELFKACKVLNLMPLIQGFKQIEDWQYTNDILLNNPAVIEAMSILPENTLDYIKYKIILDREKN